MTSEEQSDGAAVLVAEWPKNKKETIRVSLTEFRGNELLDIRTFYPTEEGMKAGKGICLQRAQLITLRKALQQAEKVLKGERQED